MSTVLYACSSEDIDPPASGKYEKGVFVVNQGNFGSGTGTLTFYDRDAILEQKAFQLNNPGQVLGNIAQSMIKVGNQLFIAINNAGKFVMLDADNLKFVNSISMIDQPRYFAAWSNQFIYLSEWGLSGIDGSIHKINPLDGSIVKTTFVGGGPEGMLVDNTDLYICKSGGFGSDSLLLKYNLLSDNVDNSYAVGPNPIDLIIDKVGTIWILCSGYFDFTNPDNNTPGRLVQFDEGVILNSWELENGVDNLAYDVASDILYFTTGDKIQKFDMRLAIAPELFFEGSFYSLKVEPGTGNLFAADAKDFTANGEVVIISPEGEKTSSFPVGQIPGFIYFVE
jgi:DNA-binding beta-propeller fold protein YncE